MTEDGTKPPQTEISVPEYVRENYEELLKTDNYPPCYKIIPSLSRLMKHSWMSALETERLERKTDDIKRRAKQCQGSWEAAYFVTMARNYGFGINAEAMEQWALNVPLNDVAHHGDNIFQIEAIFMGQAGLLDPMSVPERYRDDALADEYLFKLSREYKYLAHKYSLTPIDFHLWRFLRLRPQNFPHIRISQLANLYYHRKASLSRIIDCKDVKAAKEMLATEVTEYWQNHYAFGRESKANRKHLSDASLNLLLINTVVPMLFAYGRHKQEDSLVDRAFDFLEQLKAEDNHITRTWKDVGLNVDNAGDNAGIDTTEKRILRPSRLPSLPLRL